MGQKSYTVSQGDIEKSKVVIANDATSFTGIIRLIIKDDASKSDIIKLIELLETTFVTQDYPF